MKQFSPPTSEPAFARLNLDVVNRPIAHARAIEPIVEKLLPRTASVSLQLALKVRHAKDPEIIAELNRSHEMEESCFIQMIFHDAGGAPAAGGTQAGQGGRMRIARHFLHRGSCLAPTNGPVQTIIAIGASLNVRQPFQGFGVS